MSRRELPDLSRFELECLRMLWDRGEASAKEIHESMEDPPSYSTIRKIFERLEAKGAVERAGKVGRALLYRSTVSRPAMVRKEIQRFLDTVFDGAAAPLLNHLARMDAVDLEDLRAIEEELADGGSGDVGSTEPKVPEAEG